MINQTEIVLAPRKRGYHLITEELVSKLSSLPSVGIAHLFIRHTSAALTLNENDDPSVRTDFESLTNKLVPDTDQVFTHQDKKSSLLGAAITIPIVNGNLYLGTCEGIYLCEFQNSGNSRKIFATIMDNDYSSSKEIHFKAF